MSALLSNGMITCSVRRLSGLEEKTCPLLQALKRVSWSQASFIYMWRNEVWTAQPHTPPLAWTSEKYNVLLW